tara:strand:+ start:2906 stop:3406 length:501 start_codon:yes stop_codon:yes gene_type:complete
MRDYFNLLDTPVYKFSGTFGKNSDNGNEMAISFNSGNDHTARFLIFNVYMGVSQFSSNFDVHSELRFINNHVYQKLVINEQISSINDFIQLPNIPKTSGITNSIKNYLPTTQNMYLVMNGDQFIINTENMQVGSSLDVRLLAYTRSRVPNIDVFGGDLTTYYNNIG